MKNNKESILAEYQSNASGDRVYSNSKARKSKYSDVNDALYEWFKLATSKNIPVGGSHLIAGMETASKKWGGADQGWPAKFKDADCMAIRPHEGEGVRGRCAPFHTK